MRVECRQQVVEAIGVVVVEQQTHPHAAIGRAQQGLQQQGAGIVVVPDVVLRVDALLGRIGELDARRERVATFIERGSAPTRRDAAVSGWITSASREEGVSIATGRRGQSAAGSCSCANHPATRFAFASSSRTWQNSLLREQ